MALLKELACAGLANRDQPLVAVEVTRLKTLYFSRMRGGLLQEIAEGAEIGKQNLGNSFLLCFLGALL